MTELFRTNDQSWTSFSEEQIKEFLEQINPIDGKYRTSLVSTMVRRRSLPYYGVHELISVKDANWVNKKLEIYYLHNTTNKNLYRLNGTSPPIHEVNSKDPVNITEENVLHYLSFFCFFVRGDEGPFLVIDSLDNPWIAKSVFDWSSESMDKAGYLTLREAFQAPEYFGQDAEGKYRISTLVYYSNAIFKADFLVEPSGMLSMINDQPILADLLEKITIPIA